ncbi:DUF1761 family protein [candidate division GN15 bacterium]|nr:DUF1761 family protein [candidate division GN15 bacterium]
MTITTPGCVAVCPPCAKPVCFERGENPMPQAAINYWAVLVSGVAFTILGALWYSPVLFGNAWMRNIGKTKEQLDQEFSVWKIIGALIGSLITAYGVARLMIWTGGATIGDAILLAILVGVSFMIAPFMVNDLMEGRPTSLTVINVLFNLVGFIIIGVIVGAWQ